MENETPSLETSTSPDFTYHTEGGQDLAVGPHTDLVTDFDGVLSVAGQSQGKNPFESKIHPDIKNELTELSNKGKNIVVLTGRDAHTAAHTIDVPNVMVLGTGGYEFFKPDPAHPDGGISLIHERFHPYAAEITEILKNVRHKFAEIANVSPDALGQRENTVDMTGSHAYTERKGITTSVPKDIVQDHPDFPEGISQTYNFNEIEDDEARVRYGEALRNTYQDALHKIVVSKFSQQKGSINHAEIERYFNEIQDLCSFRAEHHSHGYGVTIEPKTKIRKGQALLTLMREKSDPKRPKYLDRAPVITDAVYAGDTNDDAAPIHAGALAEVASAGKRTVRGIFVQSDYSPRKPVNGTHSKPGIHTVGATTFNGVNENAHFLHAWVESLPTKAA